MVGERLLPARSRAEEDCGGRSLGMLDVRQDLHLRRWRLLQVTQAVADGDVGVTRACSCQQRAQWRLPPGSARQACARERAPRLWSLSRS
eukprot:7376676-Pyramimonas_sp.AAC.1